MLQTLEGGEGGGGQSVTNVNYDVESPPVRFLCFFVSSDDPTLCGKVSPGVHVCLRLEKIISFAAQQCFVDFFLGFCFCWFLFCFLLACSDDLLVFIPSNVVCNYTHKKKFRNRFVTLFCSCTLCERFCCCCC